MRNIGILFIFWVLIVFGISAAFGQTVGEQKPPVTAESIPTATVQEEPYRIGFQDVLEIQVMRHPDLNQRVAVGKSGQIVLFRLEHPLVAVCRTERELADDITKAYQEKYLKDPQISVFVSEQKSQSIAVIGAVEKPGRFFVSRRVHLLEMLALAGGPNKESGTRMLVARTENAFNCREKPSSVDDESIAVMDFKIRDVQEGKQTLWMQPGDVVSVLDADIVYMYGNVNKQGALKIRDPITLTQAIASAEGLKPAAARDKVRILRQVPGKQDREEFAFDLNQIDKGKVKDPFLEPNDIVAVSQDKSKAILLGIGNAIKNSVPNAVYRTGL